MVQDDPKTLVSTNWLKANLKHPDLRVLDASWHLPTENRDPAAEFAPVSYTHLTLPTIYSV